VDIVRQARTQESIGLEELIAGSRRSKIDFERLWVGEVLPTGGSLDFRFPDPPKAVAVPRNLLLQFVTLKNAKDVLRFARRYGSLSLCKHGLPYTHSQFRLLLEQPKFCRELEYQPIEVWLTWARKLNAGLMLAYDLHRGVHGNRQNWELVFADTGWLDQDYCLSDLGGYWQQSEHVTAERVWLEDLTNRYIQIACVRLHFSFLGDDFNETPPKIGFAGNLFGMLAIQFIHAVSNTDGPAICSSCGVAYFPDRRPKANQNHYCTTCGRKAAVRDASRRFRRANPDYYKDLRKKKRSTMKE